MTEVKFKEDWKSPHQNLSEHFQGTDNEPK